jgi:hypothetical protein
MGAYLDGKEASNIGIALAKETGFCQKKYNSEIPGR